MTGSARVSLRDLIRYDPKTGGLHWLPRPSSLFVGGRYDSARRASRWNTRYAGEVVGADNGAGYLVCRVLGVSLKCHRVAWEIYYGARPEGCIDHINGDRTDNRIENLRVVDRQGNGRNSGIRADNRSGVVGVRRRGNRWVANIRHEGVQVFLGSFPDMDAAATARRDAEQAFGYHPNHGGRPAARRLHLKAQADFNNPA